VPTRDLTMGGRPSRFGGGLRRLQLALDRGERPPFIWHSSAADTTQLLALCARHPVADAVAYSCIGGATATT